MKRIITLCCLMLLTMAGCGGDDDIAAVTGTVTMDGAPLANASVVFINPTTRPAGGSTDAQGHYVLNFSGGIKGAPIGKNKVRISTIRDASEDADGNRIPGSKETIPLRYNGLSELEFKVEPGKRNVADFKLTSDGPIANTSTY